MVAAGQVETQTYAVRMRWRNSRLESRRGETGGAAPAGGLAGAGAEGRETRASLRVRPQGQDKVDAPEGERGGRMVEEGGGRGRSGCEVAAVRRQADGADQQGDGKGARRGLVFEGEDGGAGDEGPQRADGSHQQRGSEGEPESFGHQDEAPDAERAGSDLLGGEHFAEAGARGGAEGESGFVVEGKGDVGVLHQDVVAQHRGVAQVVEDARPSGWCA